MLEIHIPTFSCHYISDCTQIAQTRYNITSWWGLGGDSRQIWYLWAQTGQLFPHLKSLSRANLLPAENLHIHRTDIRALWITLLAKKKRKEKRKQAHFLLCQTLPPRSGFNENVSRVWKYIFRSDFMTLIFSDYVPKSTSFALPTRGAPSVEAS